jgi:D-glycero-D-manno-heptose 1,7-bisphosphate phosphatase
VGIDDLTQNNSETKKAVILDRDGVINSVTVLNGVPRPPRGLSDFQLLPGVESAIEDLRNAGFLVFCLTNQPEIARGTLDRANVDAISTFLVECLGIQEVFVCAHDDADACHCRKPLAGGVEYFFSKYNLTKAGSYLVGDRWKDIEAGLSAGLTTILVSSDFYESRSINHDYLVSNITEAVEIIMEVQVGS